MDNQVGQRTPGYHTTGNFSPLPAEAFGGPVSQAIMPLVAILDGEAEFIGTGFMVNGGGVMLTAKHIIDYIRRNPDRRIKDGKFYDHLELYALYVSSAEKGPSNSLTGGLWPIHQVSHVDQLDIAVCTLHRAVDATGKHIIFPAVKLSPKIPSTNDKIVAFGYHKGDIEGQNDGTRISLHLGYKSAHAVGDVVDLHPQGNRQYYFPCFRTNARFDPGMSGAPIFQNGSVIGLVSAGMSDEGGEYLSYGSMLWPGFGIKFPIRNRQGRVELTTLFALAKRGSISVDESFARLAINDNEGENRLHITMTSQ